MSFVCPDKNCRKCPRLIAFREGNIVKFPTYYNGPVEPFGSLDAEILVVGLAPGLNGANQTNRPFTNDYAGDVLYPILKKYGFAQGEGLYTDMIAIRRDEDLDNIHSVYVDQWDWEKIIGKDQRNMDTLISTVRTIYSVLRKTEKYMAVQYDYIEEILPREIAFVSTQELVDMYPELTPKEREYQIVKEKGAVFLMQVGKTLTNGERHDGRAPDYDDWELNGDILVYYPVLDIALELSSMGIRVDEDSLDKQLTIAGCDDRRELPFQKAILNKELPYTIGGGIGQSRICMFFLRKAHIGEVHASLWSQDVMNEAKEKGVQLL